MKFSLNLANRFSDIDFQSLPIDEILLKIGAQLGAIENVEDIGKIYDGVLVVKVITADRHPDADKLSICLIDDGGVSENIERNNAGYIQVVCGAENVAANQLVIWIPPNVTVPNSHNKNPLILETRNIRGQLSNGMIASPKELAIGDSHEGIFIIDSSEISVDLAKPGTEFKKLYGLNDVIIDCENKMFTHRPDCFGNLGIAREVAGIFGKKYSSPEWYKNTLINQKTHDLPLAVKNENFDKSPRFIVQVVNDVVVKPSPMWLQLYLKNVGIKSINNIVDYTNYYLMVTGQPLHAFDYDKVKNLSSDGNVEIFPRLANKDEKLRLLNGNQIVLNNDDIVISTNKQPIALAGVMGGSETEVDNSTRNVIIECANFDMYSIRRTSMRHGLFTDAVTRFNKGQSPLQNDKVLAKMVNELIQNAGGKVASEIYDVTSIDMSTDNLNKLSVDSKFINDRLGSNITAEEMKIMLTNVEFDVSLKDQTLEITVPFWRMDITIKEDIVEEIGRLYGYDNLPVELPLSQTAPSPRNLDLDFKQNLRNILSKAGANEVLTYSFVHGDLMINTGTDPDEWAYHIRNAISPELQYYRTSLTPSLLDKVHKNIKAQAGDTNNIFAIFELGKVHIKNDLDNNGLPKQMRRLALVVSADPKTAKSYFGSAFYQAKVFLDEITRNQVTYEDLDSTKYPITSPYQKGRSSTVSVGGQVIGVIGEYNHKTKRALKIPHFSAGFEIATDLLQDKIQEVNYKPQSNYPSIIQDITFEISNKEPWQKLYNFVHAELAVAKAESGYNYTIAPLDIYREEKSENNRISFKIEISHNKKTLVTSEVNTLFENIAKVAGEKLQATRI